MKVGDKIELPANKRDLFLNRVGGLNVEVLEIEEMNIFTLKIKIKLPLTGNTTIILWTFNHPF